MSIKDGRHVHAECRCGRCGKTHTDIVPINESLPVGDRLKCRHPVMCDACYLKSCGSRALAAYTLLRKALGG